MANNLAKLFAKKAESDGEASRPESSENAPANAAVERPSEGQSESVPRKNPFAAAKTGGARNPFAGGKGSGTDGAAAATGRGTPADSGSDSSGSGSRPRLANLNLPTASPPASGDTERVAPQAIDSLDALDQSTDAGTAPRSSLASLSAFADETPAQKPTRELPEGLTKEQLGFVDLIDGVYEVLHEPDMLGQVIRNIMIELKNNSEYMKLVAPDDIRAWVRGMRDSMGLAKIKKTETKAKKGSGKKGPKVDVDVAADLDSILGDLGVALD